ncbi:MAG: GNAT family N-acetyltransferase [Chloroflexaceae bacterium]|nr:GNAT family N-acetyltransferase [Chloroflexaceae bacterium]
MKQVRAPVLLETRRLRGVACEPGHLADLQTLHRDADVARTLGGVRSDAQIAMHVRDFWVHWKEAGYGVWMWYDLTDGQFVGRAGLRRVLIEQRWEHELLYALMPRFWGQGLATELAQAIATIAFEQLHFADLVSFTLPTNQASQRVMQKLGFRFVGNITYAGFFLVLYRLASSDYSASSALLRYSGT